jgi:hypothetical protein
MRTMNVVSQDSIQNGRSHITDSKDGERGRNRTYNLLIKSQLGFNRPCSSNSQLTNNLQESCAHREPLPNA